MKSCIVEGYGRRRYKADFIKFLIYSLSSNDETIDPVSYTHLDVYKRQGQSSYGVKPVSEEGSKRLVRAAIEHALAHDLPSVSLVHKGNIMKYTEGGFKQWGYDCLLYTSRCV